mgnify:CR=1 FL=1
MEIDLYQRLFELSCVHDLPGVLERALDLLLEEAGAERGFLVLVGEQGFDVRAARGLDGVDLSTPGLQPSRTLVREALRRGEPVRVGRAQADPLFAVSETVAAGGTESLLAVPILEGQRVVAVVCVDSTRPDAFGPKSEARVRALSRPLGAVFERAAQVQRLERQGRELARRLGGAEGPAILGQSPAFLEALETARRAAAADVPVLLLGETGTGKELLANAVHQGSARAGKPLVTVNCAALAPELLESELFGHVAGAFTGALKDRPGRFAAAHGGTLFLDEVGELSPAAQARFLRALESGEVQRVGEDRVRRVDVRIVAATHRDLTAPGSGFRADLYYRLSVVAVPVPPLRQRREDVPLLAEAFCLQAGLELGRRIEGISHAALGLLARHSWPGNVRELKNAIRRAALFCRGAQITADDLPPEVQAAGAAGGPPPVEVTRVPESWDELQEAKRAACLELERRFARQLLQRTAGNVTKAARLAGATRPTLYDLLSRIEVDAGQFRPGE